jgi:hypothetical protein
MVRSGTNIVKIAWLPILEKQALVFDHALQQIKTGFGVFCDACADQFM